MCIRQFILRRCLSRAQGGCNNFWAEFYSTEECGTGQFGSFIARPADSCRGIMGGFIAESSTFQPHEYYSKSARLCLTCQYTGHLYQLQQEAENEKRGLFSDAVHQYIQGVEHDAYLRESNILNNSYKQTWAAVGPYLAGVREKTLSVWNKLDMTIHKHFGTDAMARPEVQMLVESLQNARFDLLAHVRRTTREMAITLVGPMDTSEEDAATERIDQEERALGEEAVKKAEEAALNAIEAHRAGRL
ncbi:hypothetical protein C8035_v003349 [Colletotrichum spinosum]|uniref:Uncharacterized protein n=1 Tax=Colletotrichum spinosum TaxID=1347390 RepID=A0A4R8QWU5_9PEZI|nr:hypothetical protein C8035_v003349 [Colletotrichum spinosum]